MKRPLWFFGYRRNKGHQCVCDGTNCTGADYGDLFDQYHRDPYTMQVKPFKPWTGVLPGKGKQLEGTYCPQHLMLYHNLMEWLEQEEAEADPGFFSRMAKRGIAFVPIKQTRNLTTRLSLSGLLYLSKPKERHPNPALQKSITVRTTSQHWCSIIVSYGPLHRQELNYQQWIWQHIIESSKR